MISKRKHIKNFAAFFLAFYSFFIFYAALHIHVIHFSNVDVCFVEHHNQNGISDPFLDSDNNCRLVSFSNNLYTCCQSSVTETIRDFSSADIHFESQFKPLLLFSKSLKLRAPPTAS